MEKQKTRPAMYLRVSSKEQVEGYSLDSQERTIRAFCALQGWGEPTVFIAMPFR